MNPQAWGSFAPGLFRICGSFFCFVMPEKTFSLPSSGPPSAVHFSSGLSPPPSR